MNGFQLYYHSVPYYVDGSNFSILVSGGNDAHWPQHVRQQLIDQRRTQFFRSNPWRPDGIQKGWWNFVDFLFSSMADSDQAASLSRLKITYWLWPIRIFTRSWWWFKMLFIFILKLGEDFHFDSNFWKGLQSTTYLRISHSWADITMTSWCICCQCLGNSCLSVLVSRSYTSCILPWYRRAVKGWLEVGSTTPFLTCFRSARVWDL